MRSVVYLYFADWYVNTEQHFCFLFINPTHLYFPLHTVFDFPRLCIIFNNEFTRSIPDIDHVEYITHENCTSTIKGYLERVTIYLKRIRLCLYLSLLHTHTHARNHARTHARTHAHSHSHTRARARARTHTQTLTHIVARAHTQTHIVARTHTHCITRARACAHTHTHTLSLSLCLSLARSLTNSLTHLHTIYRLQVLSGVGGGGGG